MVRVVITVGALSGVESEALLSLFPLVSEGTVAERAELVIERVAARVKCRACALEAPAGAAFTGCTGCGSKDVELTAGRELHMKSIELEVDER